jgi:cytochrome c
MYMRNRMVAFCALCTFGYSALADEAPGLGREMSAAEIAAIDFAVMPDGAGLPPGSGSASAGAALYQRHCVACHGEEGQNGLHDPLAGGQGTIAGPVPNKTVGSYWPYATTLFDYIRRAMPYQNPGTLSNDELYALTAYVLFLNGIVDEADTIDAGSLPSVEMPNRENFVWAVER